jgi:class 3 adenylate cyclase
MPEHVADNLRVYSLGTVRSLARTSGGVSFEDRGRRRLKGVGETVRVWAVREGGA